MNIRDNNPYLSPQNTGSTLPEKHSQKEFKHIWQWYLFMHFVLVAITSLFTYIIAYHILFSSNIISAALLFNHISHFLFNLTIVGSFALLIRSISGGLLFKKEISISLALTDCFLTIVHFIAFIPAVQ